MTPMNQRRWAAFKSNRRGWWSLCLFGFLFFVTLFAEFIANDKPLLVRYDGSFYVPVVQSYRRRLLAATSPPKRSIPIRLSKS